MSKHATGSRIVQPGDYGTAVSGRFTPASRTPPRVQLSVISPETRRHQLEEYVAWRDALLDRIDISGTHNWLALAVAAGIRYEKQGDDTQRVSGGAHG